MSIAEIPAHTHVANASSNPATTDTPAANVAPGNAALNLFGAPSSLAAMDQNIAANVGGSQAHLNMQPFLTVNQIPAHRHPMLASTNPASSQSPINHVLARATADAYASEFTPQPLSSQSMSAIGGSQPHTNFQPYLCINFIISLFGIFPSPT